MNDVKTLSEFRKDKLIQGLEYYIKFTPCTCGNLPCWKCLFERDLKLYKDAQKNNKPMNADKPVIR